MKNFIMCFTEEIKDKLIKEGIDAKVLSYEANDDKFYLNAKMFKEWDYG